MADISTDQKTNETLSTSQHFAIITQYILEQRDQRIRSCNQLIRTIQPWFFRNL